MSDFLKAEGRETSRQRRMPRDQESGRPEANGSGRRRRRRPHNHCPRRGNGIRDRECRTEGETRGLTSTVKSSAANEHDSGEALLQRSEREGAPVRAKRSTIEVSDETKPAVTEHVAST